MKSKLLLIIIGSFLAGVVVAPLLRNLDPTLPISSAVAAQADSPEVGDQAENGKPLISPTKARERDFYVPNGEDLDPNEIRVIACGTGMPTPRPAQAAACFLVELGNGEKFIFDIGDGAGERLFALQIPTAFLDKVFIGHLHADHFGDIGSLFVSAG